MLSLRRRCPSAKQRCCFRTIGISRRRDCRNTAENHLENRSLLLASHGQFDSSRLFGPPPVLNGTIVLHNGSFVSRSRLINHVSSSPLQNGSCNTGQHLYIPGFIIDNNDHDRPIPSLCPSFFFHPTQGRIQAPSLRKDLVIVRQILSPRREKFSFPSSFS